MQIREDFVFMLSIETKHLYLALWVSCFIDFMLEEILHILLIYSVLS